MNHQEKDVHRVNAKELKLCIRIGEDDNQYDTSCGGLELLLYTFRRSSEGLFNAKLHLGIGCLVSLSRLCNPFISLIGDGHDGSLLTAEGFRVFGNSALMTL